MPSTVSSSYSPSSNIVLRWLTDPGPDVPQHIKTVLLEELFSSTGAVIAGVMNTMMFIIAAIFMGGGRVFMVLAAAELILSTLRLVVVKRIIKARIIKARENGDETPTDFYLVTGIAWCALQGAIAFASLRSNIAPLQILGASIALGVIGPICARNYPAPRLAFLLICLCDLPFVTGAALSGNHWLLLLIPMTPPYLYGSMVTIRRFQSLSIATLRARHDSQHMARHDPLTGLLNRFGLRERLGHAPEAGDAWPGKFFTLFQLDLDGFKQVNDTRGHQAGDVLLCAVADRLRSGIRPQDLTARMGGDEFIVIAPGLLPADADHFAARLIERISGIYNLPEVGTARIGVSIGFACAPADGTVVDNLYHLADLALYEVKATAKGSERRYTAAAGTMPLAREGQGGYQNIPAPRP